MPGSCISPDEISFALDEVDIKSEFSSYLPVGASLVIEFASFDDVVPS